MPIWNVCVTQESITGVRIGTVTGRLAPHYSRQPILFPLYALFASVCFHRYVALGSFLLRPKTCCLSLACSVQIGVGNVGKGKTRYFLIASSRREKVTTRWAGQSPT